MLFRQISYQNDYRSGEAAQLIYRDVFGCPTPPDDAAERLDEITNGHLNYLLEDSDNLIAVGTIESQYFESRVATIANVAVAQCLRGMGIGSKLIEYFEDEARSFGCEVIRLSSLDSSIGFYERIGYKQINPIKPNELGKAL